MVRMGTKSCPNCGGDLKHFSSVNRLIRTDYGKRHFTKIELVVCEKCGKYHRVLPYYIFPYKHYRSDIICGMVTGALSNDMLRYEDYPCESTVERWRVEYAKISDCIMKYYSGGF